MHTALLDTMFFIWLSNADDARASEVADRLTELDIQILVGPVVVDELITRTAHPDRDTLLLERLSRLRRPPVHISWSGASLEALRLPGRERQALAAGIREMQERSARANIISVLPAVRKLDVAATLEAVPELRRVPFVSRLVKIKQGAPRSRVGRVAASAAKLVGTTALRVLRSAMPRAVEEPLVAEEIRKVIFAGDKRRMEGVATGALPASVIDNSDRDAKHMACFVVRRSLIDWVQVDRAQLNLIKNPSHPIARLGLSNRVFAASDLFGTIAELDRLDRVTG